MREVEPASTGLVCGLTHRFQQIGHRDGLVGAQAPRHRTVCRGLFQPVAPLPRQHLGLLPNLQIPVRTRRSAEAVQQLMQLRGLRAAGVLIAKRIEGPAQFNLLGGK